MLLDSVTPTSAFAYSIYLVISIIVIISIWLTPIEPTVCLDGIEYYQQRGLIQAVKIDPHSLNPQTCTQEPS